MRRQKVEEPDNKERWLVSYADFITLLFAFFVVMYSISSVNEGKYKVLSQTLEGVFNAPEHSVKPIQVGDKDQPSKQNASDITILQPIRMIPKNGQGKVGDGGEIGGGGKALDKIADQVMSKFSGLIAKGTISINQNNDWLEISLRNNILFDSGGVEPTDTAIPIIEKMAKILKQFDNAIMIEGFTDNVPIKTSYIPSNWELSADRSASIVRLMAFEGVDPSRMSAIGYGEYQSIASNATPEGRAKNRRVVILVSKDKSVRESIRKRNLPK
jgi:chemotaxis protein MotB